MAAAPPATEEHGAHDELAPVVDLEPRRRRAIPRGPRAPLSLAALLVAVVLAFSPLASGYYNFTSWAPLSLGAVVVLVVLAMAARPTFTRFGLTAATGLGLLLALSFGSMLWAESRESAWTDSNRLALYCVIFAIGLLAVRERRSARAVLLILGTPAVVVSIVLALELVLGSGSGAFLTGRLDSPIGYINGTAGLLVMGIWPWIALAESQARRRTQAAALAAASAIASTAVLTQSRAIVPAMLVAIVLALVASPLRTRRTIHFLLIALAVAVGLHWTLAVYSTTGPTQSLPIPDGVRRGAGLAILGAAVVGLLGKLLLSEVSARVSPKARDRATKLAGRSLLSLTVAAVAAIAIFGGGTISRQWGDFTHLNAEQAAPNRFLDAGGFRYDLWRIAIDEFRSHPLGGVGAGSYDSEYYRLRQNPQSVIQPHSLELQMAAELGIGGFLALLLFCGSILWAGVSRRWTLAATDPMIRVAALGIFSAWLAATSVDWLYDIPGLGGMAILAAAMLVVPAPGSREPADKPGGELERFDARAALRRRRAQAGLVIGLGLLALVAASIGRQYVGARYELSGAAEIAHNPAGAIRTLATAESLDPFSLQTLYSISSAYARLDDYPAARQALLIAERKEPDNYVPPALLGDLATRKGYERVALSEYRRALRLDPHEPALQSAVKQAEAAIG